MLDEFASNARSDLDGDSAHLLRSFPFPSLSGAVIDQVRHPSLMLPHDCPPEENPIGACATCPLIREAFLHARKPKSVRPDPSYCQLRPIGDVRMDWDLGLILHDLFLGKELLQESQCTISLAGQEEHLQ